MKKFILVILLSYLTGCSSLNKITNVDVQDISGYENARRFNGSYLLHRKPVENNIYSLDEILKFKTDFDNESGFNSVHFVKITMLNETALRAELYSNDQLLETKTLKGRIKKNFFHINKELENQSFHFFHNTFISSISRIAILPNGNLTADYEFKECSSFIMFLIICSRNSAYGGSFENI